MRLQGTSGKVEGEAENLLGSPSSKGVNVSTLLSPVDARYWLHPVRPPSERRPEPLETRDLKIWRLGRHLAPSTTPVVDDRMDAPWHVQKWIRNPVAAAPLLIIPWIPSTYIYHILLVVPSTHPFRGKRNVCTWSFAISNRWPMSNRWWIQLWAVGCGLWLPSGMDCGL